VSTNAILGEFAGRLPHLPVGVYRHYKGDFYQLIGIGRNSETNELMAAYVSLNGVHMPGPRLSFRPLSGPEGFLTPVSGVGQDVVPRFRYVGLEIPEEDRKKFGEKL
jgi:hypothetical protein